MAYVKKYRAIVTAFLATLITVVLAQGVGATSILDQAQESADGGAGFFRFVCLAQTFTPAISEQLNHVDVLIEGFLGENDPDYPATISIVETVGGVPNGSVLGSVYMSGGFVAGWNSIDFLDQSVVLAAGSIYGIVLQSGEVIGGGNPSDGLGVQWSGNPYSGGALWEGTLVHTNPDVWDWELALFVDDPNHPDYAPQGAADGAFRTYAEVAVIPETISLIATFMGCLVLLGYIVTYRKKLA